MLNVKNTVLFTLFAVNLIDQPAPEVKVEQGFLSGKISADGKIHEYVGIPYATLRGRFQAPLPAPSWNGVYKAMLEHYQCPQAMGPMFIGNEDCLKINVYRPALVKKSLPVMVYIHGGAFILGSGGKMVYGADFLVNHDVIVVTFNYRLGALGFLCLGIEEAPGNAGLKDQLAALRWVKKNIGAFGGDPDNVTLFGHSAGAVSSSLLVLSDATNGLFKRALIQSGSGISFMSSKDGVDHASAVAKKLGYNTKNPKALYNILSATPTDELVRALSGESFLQLARSDLIFLPCIENNLPSIEPIFTELPYTTITQEPKNISVIYGFTDREGFYLTAEETEETLKELNEELFNYPDLKFPSKHAAESITGKVKEYYFGDKLVSNETIENLSQFTGDVYFEIPIVMESELMVNKVDAPIYNYYFKYSGGRNLVKEKFSKNKNEPGASHGDDLLYIFTANVWPFKIKERDQKIIDWMTKMWTNFAKYGEPTPASDKSLPIKWKPSTKEGLNFLYIDEELEMGPIPNPERYQLWKDLYQKYRNID